MMALLHYFVHYIYATAAMPSPAAAIVVSDAEEHAKIDRRARGIASVSTLSCMPEHMRHAEGRVAEACIDRRFGDSHTIERTVGLHRAMD
jgi:hypothetical protein